MPRAVLQKGVVYPVEPLPPEWRDGMEVTIESSPSSAASREAISTTDEWMDEVDALAAQLSPEADELLAIAIAQLRQDAKELARQGKM